MPSSDNNSASGVSPYLSKTVRDALVEHHPEVVGVAESPPEFEGQHDDVFQIRLGDQVPIAPDDVVGPLPHEFTYRFQQRLIGRIPVAAQPATAPVR